MLCEYTMQYIMYSMQYIMYNTEQKTINELASVVAACNS